MSSIPLTRFSLACCCGSILTMLTCAAHAEVAPAGRSFVDRFEQLDAGRWFVSHGWANGDHQGCAFSKHNIKLGRRGIELVLNKLAHAKRDYACAELQSRARYQYGTYEVRLRSASGPGVVTSFFTYTGPGQTPGATHHEIDFEFLGKNTRSVQLNYFADGVGGHEAHVPLDNDASAQFNAYAFEWLPERLRWFVNTKLVRQEYKVAGQPFPDMPSRIIISLWSGAGPSMRPWLNEFKYSGAPLVAAYDYISFTAAGEPCKFPESIVCHHKY